ADRGAQLSDGHYPVHVRRRQCGHAEYRSGSLLMLTHLCLVLLLIALLACPADAQLIGGSGAGVASSVTSFSQTTSGAWSFTVPGSAKSVQIILCGGGGGGGGGGSTTGGGGGGGAPVKAGAGGRAAFKGGDSWGTQSTTNDSAGGGGGGSDVGAGGNGGNGNVGTAGTAGGRAAGGGGAGGGNFNGGAGGAGFVTVIAYTN